MRTGARIAVFFMTVILIGAGSITDAQAKTKRFVATEKEPLINVTRSTTDESGAVVGISVKSSGNVGMTVKSDGSAKTTKRTGSVAGISYDKLVMANVVEAVNVRAEADEKSERVGMLYANCGGEIQEQKTGWTKIKSGKLVGWVRNDYLVFGEVAAAEADKSAAKTATSTTETLRVRREPGESAEIIDLLAEGDTIEVIDSEGDWVKVEFADGTQGYVSGKYVTISVEIGKGETMEQINAREAKDKVNEQKIAADVAAASQKPAATNNGAVPAAIDDVQLLAALIQCEAGSEIYEGQVAVGAVVMNRLRSGRYGNSLYSVIYAKGQFSPAGSGKVAEVLAAGPKAICIQAATEALAGVTYVGNATSFRPVRSGRQGQILGNHVFW